MFYRMPKNNLSFVDIISCSKEKEIFKVMLTDGGTVKPYPKWFESALDAYLSGFEDGQRKPVVSKVVVLQLPSGQYIKLDDFYKCLLSVNKEPSVGTFSERFEQLLNKNPKLATTVGLTIKADRHKKSK